MTTTWNYFKPGHGKGPCDGLGRTAKCMADEAVRQGNAVIPDPWEFFNWGEQSSMKDVKFLCVQKSTCEEKKRLMNEIIIKPVKNTMKFHAVVGTDKGTLLTRETSCYCVCCMEKDFCDTWSTVIPKQTTVREPTSCQSSGNNDRGERISENVEETSTERAMKNVHPQTTRKRRE